MSHIPGHTSLAVVAPVDEQPSVRSEHARRHRAVAEIRGADAVRVSPRR
jgi:hypothetical protein